MRANVFQQQYRHSFAPCFLQKCLSPFENQLKSSPSSYLKNRQKSGLVWRRPFNASQRTNSLKNFFFCQNVKVDEQMVNLNQIKKKSQFQRIRQKKAYQGDARSIKKINQIKHAKASREEVVNARSVSKNKLSLSSRKSNTQNQINPKHRIRGQFVSFTDQQVKRYYANEQNKSAKRPNKILISDSQFKNRLIQTAIVSKNYQSARPDLYQQSNHKTRCKITNATKSSCQFVVHSSTHRPVDYDIVEKNQLNINQGLFSTRHGSNYNILSSVSIRQSNKNNAESRKIDDLRNQRSQIVAFQYETNCNSQNKTDSLGQKARDNQIKAKQVNQIYLVSPAQRIKTLPINTATESMAKDQINESNSALDSVYSSNHRSPSVT